MSSITQHFAISASALTESMSHVMARFTVLHALCTIVIDTHLLRYRLIVLGQQAVRLILLVKLSMSLLQLAPIVHYRPCLDGAGWWPMLMGGIATGSAEIEQALHRVHVSGVPPSNQLADTVSRIVLVFAHRLRGALVGQETAIFNPRAYAQPSIMLFAASFAVETQWSKQGGWLGLFPLLLAVLTWFMTSAITLPGRVDIDQLLRSQSSSPEDLQ